MSSLPDNRMVWDRRPGHYEVWYLVFNHLPSRTGFWLRHLVHAPVVGHGDGHAALWFARFDPAAPATNFGIHRHFPLASLDAQSDPFCVRIADDAELRHDGATGRLAGDGHEITWDLTWDPAEKSHLHLPALLYKSTFGDTRVLSPNPSQPARGKVIVDGKTYELSGEPISQQHVWGRKHSYQWAWAHCGVFEDATTARFDAISVRVKRGAVVLPRLTLFTLELGGETLSFRELWKLPTARSDYATGRYHLVGVGPEARVEAEIRCRAEDTILSEYVDPDGDPAFCHNNCASDMTVRLKRRSPFVGRWRDAEQLTARQTVSWEWGARAGDAYGVKKRHVLVE